MALVARNAKRHQVVVIVVTRFARSNVQVGDFQVSSIEHQPPASFTAPAGTRQDARACDRAPVMSKPAAQVLRVGHQSPLALSHRARAAIDAISERRAALNFLLRAFTIATAFTLRRFFFSFAMPES